MKILPTILGLLSLTSAGLPMYTQLNGNGLSNLPIQSQKASDCRREERDKYGRCPAKTSNFRYLSTGSGGTSGTRSGSGFGGGK